MANFTHVVSLAYREILLREPDPGGLAHFSTLMQEGLTEASLRESLARSPEFASRFPGTEPPPPPPPPPPPGTGMSLHVEGNRFVSAAGQPVRLLGTIVCCAAPDTPDVDSAHVDGWPLVTTVALDRFAAHALNYTHIRLGPCGTMEPNPVQGYFKTADGRFDLTRWDDGYWARLRQIVWHAFALRIYVEADLIDKWVREHGRTDQPAADPWSAHNNVQAQEWGGLEIFDRAPGSVHEAWIRKAVAELGGFDNILFHDSNEAWKRPISSAWILGMQSIVKDELRRHSFPNRLFGTNCSRPDIEVACDYATRHEKFAQEPEPYPVMVNEYGGHSPTFVWEQIQAGWRDNTHFHYWQGGHTTTQRQTMLAKMQELITGVPVPNPNPVPAECPWLIRTGCKIHSAWFGSSVLGIPDPVLNTPRLKRYGVVGVSGGMMRLDCTPRYDEDENADRGQPCNDEHPGCGGRQCEDPRGPVWERLEGPADFRVESDNPYLLKIGPLRPGHYRFRCCPRPDARDGEEGKALRIGPNPCSIVEWDVA